MAFKKKSPKPSKTILKQTNSTQIDFELGAEQQRALEELRKFWIAEHSEFYLLKGYAGTGKSTLCSVFLSELPRHQVRLCASTNKAASVLNKKNIEIGLSIQATTIHKLLKLVPQQIGDQWRLRQMDEPNLKQVKLIVIDECSMIDDDLWQHLQDLPFKYKLKILFMGDPAQLPPINETASSCFQIPFYSELTEIYRQGKDHPILEYSFQLRKAVENKTIDLPLPTEQPGIKLFKTTKTWLNALRQDYSKKGAKEELDKIQILTWTNHRVEKWNTWVQKHIYPSEHGPFSKQQPLILTSPVTKGGWKTPQQIVMANNESVKVIASKSFEWRSLNLWELDIRAIDGTMATIIYVSPEQKEIFKQECMNWKQTDANNFSIDKQIENIRRQCLDIKAATTLTTHRSQGSSFETVYLDLPSILSCPNRTERIQMLYVAVTRAKQQLMVLMP